MIGRQAEAYWKLDGLEKSLPERKLKRTTKYKKVDVAGSCEVQLKSA
jgi:hypothetical protein